MLDPDLFYIEARRREIAQQVARYALVQQFEADRPGWRERWRHYRDAFRMAWGRWIPGLSTTRLAPAAVRVLQHKRGGKNL